MFKRYIEVFFLGIFIACTALFLQVFVAFLIEILVHQNFSLDNIAQKEIIFVIVYFVINGLIEEALRLAVIKQRMVSILSEKIAHVIILSTLLGLGFWTFEIILNYFARTIDSQLIIIALPALFIHVAMSLLIVVCLQMKKYSIQFVLILATFLHVLSNIILFFSMN
jgi:hypothetical protein